MNNFLSISGLQSPHKITTLDFALPDCPALGPTRVLWNSWANHYPQREDGRGVLASNWCAPRSVRDLPQFSSFMVAIVFLQFWFACCYPGGCSLQFGDACGEPTPKGVSSHQIAPNGLIHYQVALSCLVQMHLPLFLFALASWRPTRGTSATVAHYLLWLMSLATPSMQLQAPGLQMQRHVKGDQ